MPAVSAASRFQAFCGGVFATVALLHLGLLRFGWQGVLPGLALVSAWWALIAFIQPAWNNLHARALSIPPSGSPASPRPRFRQHLSRLAAPAFVAAQSLLALAFATLAWRQLRALAASSPTPALPLTPDATLTRTLVLSVALFFLLYFLRQAVASREIPRRADPRPGLTLLLILLLAQAAAGLATLYAPSWNLARPLAFATTAIACLLPLEWLLSSIARWFQSPSQRRAHPFSGYSLSTGALLGGSSPLQTIATSVHDAFGLEIRGSWLARYARLCVEPLLLIVVLTGWLSTAVVIVPPDSEAVRVT